MNWDGSKPKFYAQSNIIQRGRATKAWNDFMTSFSAGSASFNKILDMGCGVGDITENLVKWKDLKVVKDEGVTESKQLQDGAYQENKSPNKEIVGTDLSQQMISFCNDERKKVVEDAFGDPVRLSFEVADSGDPAGAVWKDKKAKFDLVTSFTAFHWIADQKKVLECVASCLKPGGHFLILLWLQPGDAWFQTGENLKAHPKWSSFLKEIKQEFPVAWETFKHLGLISNLLDSSAIAEAYMNLASEVGLDVESSKTSVETVFLEEKKFRVMVAAMTPFLKVVPEDMREDLLDDFLIEFKKINPQIVQQDELKTSFDFSGEWMLVWGVKKP